MAGYSVDEFGRCQGFTASVDPVGAFGEYLTGAAVEDGDGRTGRVVKVYQHIQTGNPGSGASNFCAVEIEWDDAD